MPPKVLFSAPDLARVPIVVNARALNLSEGMRAGLAVVAIIALNDLITLPALLEAALAALLTCICDPGGPIRRRVPILISFTLIGAAITVVYGLLRNFGPAVALPLGVFGLFCSAFVRIYGQPRAQLGTLLSVVQILSLDHGHDPATAAILGGAFIAGGLWATLLMLVLWKVYPFLPARRAVAEAYRLLSELVDDLNKLVRTKAVSDTVWEAHARIHRRATREAIETARTAIMDTARARGPDSERAAQAVIRLESADQIFGGLIALSDLLEHTSDADRMVAQRILRRLGPVLLTLGRGMINDDTAAIDRINRSIDAITADAAHLPPDHPLRAVVGRITERLRITWTLAIPANIAPGADPTGRLVPVWPRVIRPLRANLSWRSPALRHALRTAVMAVPPLAFTMAWYNPYDHWLTITIVATLQPYFSLTVTRAIERIGGTVAGGLIAAAVGLVCTTAPAIGVAMFVMSTAAFALRTVSYGLFMTALTPLVVLLVETEAPGTGEWHIAFARAGLTTIGGIVAVAANFLLWPQREPDLVAGEVKKAIAAHAAYADADFSVLLGEGSSSALAAARREAGVATNMLEALITRSLLEPRNKQRDRLEAAMVIDAALRRCAGRLTTLQYDPASLNAIPPAVLRAWRDWIAGSLRLLSSGTTALTARPQGSQADALTRMARQIELMAGAMERLA